MTTQITLSRYVTRCTRVDGRKTSLVSGMIIAVPDSGAVNVGEALAAENLVIGQPVYISRATGQAGAADAAVYQKSFIVGYAVNATLTGYVVQIAEGMLTLSDWTALTGSSSLGIGQTYFLNAGGGLTSTPPSKANSAALVAVGIAITATSLNIQPNNPILL